MKQAEMGIFFLDRWLAVSTLPTRLSEAWRLFTCYLPLPAPGMWLCLETTEALQQFSIFSKYTQRYIIYIWLV